MTLYIRVGTPPSLVRAEPAGRERARLLEIPESDEASLYDIVRYDPGSAEEAGEGTSYRVVEVAEPSGYRAYLAWGVLRRPREWVGWSERLRTEQVVARPLAWITDSVRQIAIAIPPSLSALETLTLLNRHASEVEVISPLLAAHADDLERTKSDLERAVAWGAPDAELTYAVAEAFEEHAGWDEAVTFWERLAHILPSMPAARERLAVAYARLGVYPMAAEEFDRAANLSEDPAYRERLLAARDLMWERSKV